MSERGFYRIGGACAVIGGVLAVIFNLLHPRTWDVLSTLEELQLITDNSEWLFVHVAIAVALLLLIPGLIALARSLASETGAPWARATLYAAMASVPLALLTVVLDGIAFSEIAERWSAASGAERETITVVAEAVGDVGLAIFDGMILLLFGVTPILAGLALAGSGPYPKWLSPTALAAGALGLIVGLVQSFRGTETLTTNVLFPISSLVFTIVLIVAGWTLWRKSDALEPSIALP